MLVVLSALHETDAFAFGHLKTWHKYHERRALNERAELASQAVPKAQVRTRSTSAHHTASIYLPVPLCISLA